MNSSRVLWLVVALGMVMTRLVGASEPARHVFSAPWGISLDTTSVKVNFSRPSEATYFDAAQQRIVTVKTNVPRFLAAPPEGKRWGTAAGLLLEGATVNLLTDSSFENADPSGAWQFTGQVTREANAGVHGQFGLYVKGPATITHVPVQVNTWRTNRRQCIYLLSLYVRRKDGAEVKTNEVRCTGRPSDTGPWDERQVVQLEPQRQGKGPWYRVSARVGYPDYQDNTPPTTDKFIHSFIFDGNEYYVDAAQLENAGGSNNYTAYYGAPTTYVPTTTQAVSRVAEVLSAPAKELLPGREWSYAFWSYVSPPDSSQLARQRIFSVWGEAVGSTQLLITARQGIANSIPTWNGAGANKVPSTGWVYITVTYDGKALDFFVNGISDHNKNGPFPVPLPSPLPGTAYWARGLPPGWSGEELSPCGLIADFETWDHALTPEEIKGLYITGTPALLPANPDDIPLAFTLKKSGKVSLNLYYQDGRLAHQLLIGKEMKAGKQSVYWDGCDDLGQPVPAGKYRIKGLVSNVRSEWDGKLCNTSSTDIGEFKQYRTGHYFDVAPLTDGGLITLSAWGEHGHDLQAIGGPPNYTVRWSADTPWVAFGIAVAADGDCVYTVFPHWTEGQKTTREGVVRWSLATGVQIPYPEGGPAKVSPKGVLWLNETHPGQSWPGSDCDRTKPFDQIGVCGLAARDGKLYVPLLLENRVAILDAKSGVEERHFEAPTPRKIALDAAGRIYVTSGHEVLRFATDGSDRQTVVAGLDDACGVAVGLDGRIFVTDLGKSQQLKVFDSSGKPLKVFGRPGGHQGGRVALDLLQAPVGVAIDGKGLIYLADLGGLRVLILNPDFTLCKEIHSRMPYTLSGSQLDRSLFYQSWPGGDFMEYRMDYQTKGSTITRRWSTTQQPYLKGWPFDSHGDQAYFHRWGKRTFAIWPAQCAMAEIDGDRFLPRVRMGVMFKHPEYRMTEAIVQDGATWSIDAKCKEEASYIWRDRNGDGLMQASEFEFGDWPMAKTQVGWHQDGWVDAEGSMYYPQRGDRPDLLIGVVKVPCEGLDEHGVPKYAWTSAKYVVTIPANMTNLGRDGKPWPVRTASVMMDKAGNYYVSDAGDFFSSPDIPRGIMKFNRKGEFQWRVGRATAGAVWHPGEVIYCGNGSGIVDDRYLFYVDYVGEMNVWDTDGLWLARLFTDLPDGLFYGGETFNGLAFRHPDNGKVYAYSSSDCIYRTMRIVVKGLEDIERFDGSVNVTQSVAPRMTINQEKVWRILPRQDKVWIDGEINAREWGTDTDRQAPERFSFDGSNEAARVWAQWDNEALYLAWKIQDSSPLVNTSRGVDKWQGDQVELMLRAKAGLERDGGTGHSKDEFQIAIGTDADRHLSAVVQINGSERQGKELFGAEVAVKIWPKKDGYNMEARIPWSALGEYRPTKGDKIRWNMVIDWGADDKGSQRQLKWKPGWHVPPYQWGQAVLE